MSQISLCFLDDFLNNAQAAVTKLIPLKGPDPFRWEKNWLPFVKEDQLYMIYGYEPFIVYKVHVQQGECQEFLKKDYRRDYNLDLSRFRGSAPPISYKDGYLCLVHEVYHVSDSKILYTHRFIHIGEDFHLKRISKSFVFQTKGIEFCPGMTINNEELILTFGREDKEAYFCRMKLEDLEKLFFYDLNP